MTTLDHLPTYRLQRKYAILFNILETNSIQGSYLSPVARNLVGQELVVIAGILDNRSLVTDAGEPDTIKVIHYDETGEPVGVGLEIINPSDEEVDDYAIESYVPFAYIVIAGLRRRQVPDAQPN